MAKVLVTSIKGPQGPEGPRGPAGPGSTVPGPPGKDGVNGQNGRDGVDGVNGQNGRDGADAPDQTLAISKKQDRNRSHPGLRTIIAGDSIGRGADGVTNGHAGSWVRYLSALSYGAIRVFRNAAVAGSTSTQMLARFKTEVLAYSPDLVIIEGITPNDKTGSDAALPSKSKANIVAMVEQALAVGARVIVCTGPPNNDATINARMRDLSAWLISYAANLGIGVWDLYTPIADSATGTLRSIYDTGDGIHPNTAGREAIAQYNWDRRSNDLLPGGILATLSDPYSVIKDKGLFTADANNDGISDSLAPSGVTGSRVERSDGEGFIQTLTGTSALHYVDIDATYAGDIVAAENLNFRAGDRFVFSGEVENVDSAGFNAQVNVIVGTTTNQLRAISNWQLQGKGFRSFYMEETVPADYVGGAVRIRMTTGIGTVRYSRVRLINLSAIERAADLDKPVPANVRTELNARPTFDQAGIELGKKVDKTVYDAAMANKLPVRVLASGVTAAPVDITEPTLIVYRP